MNINSVIVRYSEIATKGKNRADFEKNLVRNIIKSLKYNHVTYKSIRRVYSRIVVELGDENIVNINSIKDSLKKVFGVVNFSFAESHPLNIKLMKEKALLLYKEAQLEKKLKISFRISTQRINKSFEKTSQEINEELGAFIVDNTNAKVDLKNPDINIHIEILDKAYFFLKKEQGLSGLPVNKNNKFIISLRDDYSIVAAYLMMRRGLYPIFVNSNNKAIGRIEQFLYGEIVHYEKLSHDEIKDLVINKKAFLVETINKLDKNIIVKLEEKKQDYPILAPLLFMHEETIKTIIEVASLNVNL